MAHDRRKEIPPPPQPLSGTSASAPALSPDTRSSDLLRVPEAAMLVNPNGALRDANSTALALLGYTAAELIGQPFGRFVAERKKERKKERTDCRVRRWALFPPQLHVPPRSCAMTSW